jgi:hypothetical protein
MFKRYTIGFLGLLASLSSASLDPFYHEKIDDSTFSNWQQIRTANYTWTVWDIDFDNQIIQATSEIDLVAQENGVNFTVLDVAYLDIKTVAVNYK